MRNGAASKLSRMIPLRVWCVSGARISYDVILVPPISVHDSNEYLMLSKIELKLRKQTMQQQQNAAFCCD